MSEITPLMLQYQSIKDNYLNEILFFRLGDFYEMFNEDAIEVSRLLNLTLTHRADSPMCGIPYHAAKIYIARLLRLGKKIAICEQVGEISKGKGLTERKVIEVITPGTAIEEEYLDRGVNNYLASLCLVPKLDKNGHATRSNIAGFAFVDVSTASFSATSWDELCMEEEFARELGRCTPRELILPQSLQNNTSVCNVIKLYPDMSVSYYPDWHFATELSYNRLLKQFQTAHLRSFSLTESSPEVAPAGFLIDYLSKTSNSALPHINTIKVYKESDYVIIDDSSRRNLEILTNLRDGSSQYTLLETVNYTVTAMGNRLIRSWLSSPLTDCAKIKARQSHVSEFVSNRQKLKAVRDALSSILDVERLASRIAMERAHAKDLQALRASLEAHLNVRKLTDSMDMGGISTENSITITELIKNSILDDPSTSLTDGGIIKEGWSKDLDHYRSVQNNFNKILDEYTEEERQKTGILNLKVRYNRIIGYYIEVTKGKLDSVPSHFILRRALVNGDRYTTEKLTELEHELNSAGAMIVEEEKKLFLEIRNKIKEYIPYLMNIASEIGYTDSTSAFAHAAIENNWVCPEIDDSLRYDVIQGRHPVVEKHLDSGEFVPNDALLSDKTFALITGPNMAGKSTYLRQNALITLLAQSGSFVPAKEAHIGIVDHIFCRVGASDNLARGESTFLVEMSETALILRAVTKRSLVIMDEVGRGTSTEDGLSIAWAVSEFLLNVGCKTLFATHYHELSRLTHANLNQLCMDVLEQEGKIVFLKRVKSGASSNSYGLHVARLAGVPSEVINRATEILHRIQTTAGGDANQSVNDNNFDTATNTTTQPQTVLSQSSSLPQQQTSSQIQTTTLPGLFSDEELVLDEILSVEPDSMTPLEALQIVARWKKTLSGR